MAGRDCSTGRHLEGWSLSSSLNPNKSATSLEHSKALYSLHPSRMRSRSSPCVVLMEPRPLSPSIRTDGRLIPSSCDNRCSSRVDDDIVINLSWAMLKLKYLRLGDDVCPQSTTCVAVKGLVALAHYCPNLSTLRVYFQVDSLSNQPAGPSMAPNAEFTASWKDCALVDLEVGAMSVSEESVLMVSLTLLRIFPRIETVDGADRGWVKVQNAIKRSSRIVDRSSKSRLLATP